MSRFSRVNLVIGCAAACCIAACSSSHTDFRPADTSADTGGRPNVLFVLVDDLGWRDLGVQGSDFYESPNIDALAAQSVRFTNAYAASPVCSPTRAAILTGKHPARLHITNWIPGDNPRDRRLIGADSQHALPLAEVTLAEALKRTGYRTFFAGKWHLGGDGFAPQDQGFDINIGGIDRGRPPGGYYSPYSNPALKDGPVGEYLTDRLTSEAISFMRQHRDERFFVYLSLYAVHTPLQGARPHINKFAKKARDLPSLSDPAQIPEHAGLTKQRQDNVEYASMIYSVDENVGRLMKALDDLNLADNTIVVFTSDNGGRSTLYVPGDATSNRPLRAGKGWVYEGGTRVPLIVRAPDQLVSGRVSPAIVTSMDFYPTILEMIGAEPMPDQHVDGQSFKNVLDRKVSSVRDEFLVYYPHYHGSASVPSVALRQGNWKFVKFYESGELELYDLDTDVGEQRNLASAMPELADAMDSAIEARLQAMSARRPTANSEYVQGREALRFKGLEP